MIKAWFIFLLLFFYCAFSYAQIMPGTAKPYPEIRILKVKQPLVVIGNLETNYNSLVLDKENLEILKVYKDSQELVPFGKKGEGGIIQARLKKNISLLRLAEVLDYYQVPATNRTLKVMVNKSLIQPDLFLADVSRIKKIEKIKQDITSPLLYSLNPNEEYLNIITVKE